MKTPGPARPLAEGDLVELVDPEGDLDGALAVVEVAYGANPETGVADIAVRFHDSGERETYPETILRLAEPGACEEVVEADTRARCGAPTLPSLTRCAQHGGADPA